MLKNLQRQIERILPCVASGLIPLMMLSACSSTPIATELPNYFESRARAVEVNRPTLLFRDKFYNVDIGDFKVSNANISQPVISEQKYEVNKKRRNNTLYNFIFKNELNIETVDVSTIANSQKRSFSFDIEFSAESLFQSSCEINSVRHSKKESESNSIRIGSKSKWKSSGGPVITEGEGTWQFSNAQCELSYHGQNWQLQLLAFKDKVPQLSLTSGNSQYRLKPMYVHVGGSDYTRLIVQENDATNFESVRKPFFGVSISKNDKVLSNVALHRGDSATIWLDNHLTRNEFTGNELSEKEANFLLGINHTLIMASWFDEFAE